MIHTSFEGYGESFHLRLRRTDAPFAKGFHVNFVRISTWLAVVYHGAGGGGGACRKLMTHIRAVVIVNCGSV